MFWKCCSIDMVENKERKWSTKERESCAVIVRAAGCETNRLDSWGERDMQNVNREE